MMFSQDAPVVIIFKAMGIATDQEIMQMIGSEESVTSAFMASFEEAQRLKVFTQLQVKRWYKHYLYEACLI